MAKICFAMFGRVLLGKVFCFWGGIFFAECGFAPVLLWGCLEGYPLRRFSPCKKISKKRNDTWVVPYKHFFRYCHNPVSRSALFKNSHLPPKPKLPHKTPTLKKAKQNFARVMVGVLWGSSGRMREAWREKEPPPKGGSFSLQGLPPLPPPRQPQNETVEEVEERGENESNHQNRGNRADAEQKSHR